MLFQNLTLVYLHHPKFRSFPFRIFRIFLRVFEASLVVNCDFDRVHFHDFQLLSAGVNNFS